MVVENWYNDQTFHPVLNGESLTFRNQLVHDTLVLFVLGVRRRHQGLNDVRSVCPLVTFHEELGHGCGERMGVLLYRTLDIETSIT